MQKEEVSLKLLHDWALSSPSWNHHFAHRYLKILIWNLFFKLCCSKIILLQAVQAAQITFEDFFMADLQIAPLKIVGYEGFFGMVIMICVMLPIVQHLPGSDGHGLHEDTIETLKVRNIPANANQICFVN